MQARVLIYAVNVLSFQEEHRQTCHAMKVRDGMYVSLNDSVGFWLQTTRLESAYLALIDQMTCEKRLHWAF